MMRDTDSLLPSPPGGLISTLSALERAAEELPNVKRARAVQVQSLCVDLTLYPRRGRPSLTAHRDMETAARALVGRMPADFDLYVRVDATGYLTKTTLTLWLGVLGFASVVVGIVAWCLR